MRALEGPLRTHPLFRDGSSRSFGPAGGGISREAASANRPATHENAKAAV